MVRHNIAPPLDIPLNRAEMPLKSTETQKVYTNMPKAIQLILGAFKRKICVLRRFGGAAAAAAAAVDIPAAAARGREKSPQKLRGV